MNKIKPPKILGSKKVLMLSRYRVRGSFPADEFSSDDNPTQWDALGGREQNVEARGHGCLNVAT